MCGVYRCLAETSEFLGGCHSNLNFWAQDSVDQKDNCRPWINDVCFGKHNFSIIGLLERDEMCFEVMYQLLIYFAQKMSIREVTQK
jgi:hypothetical protein